MILDVVNRFLSLFVLYINTEIGKNRCLMLAGDHLYGKKLFTWLSLVMSLLMSLCAVLFSREMSWMGSGT